MFDDLEWQEIPEEWDKFIHTPMNYTDTRLFFGEQGSGKSVSTVACAIDEVSRYVNYIVTPDEEKIKANALTEKEIIYMQAPIENGGMGIQYNHLHHFRIFNEKGNKSKLIYLPDDCCILSPVKVFANRVIYGTKYVPFNIEQFIAYFNDKEFLTNGWFVLSEAALLSRKDTMTHLGKFMEFFGSECRKRHLKMSVDMQFRKQINPLFLQIATTMVDCSYDKETTDVYLDVNHNSPTMTSTSYNSYQYRRFFNTDELMGVPQYKIDRALSAIRGEV